MLERLNAHLKEKSFCDSSFLTSVKFEILSKLNWKIIRVDKLRYVISVVFEFPKNALIIIIENSASVQ